MEKEELFQIQNNTLNVKSGDILISEPFLGDFYFSRSVILLIDHNEKEGSLGLIINKKLSLPLNEVIHDFPRFDGDLYLGGPVATDSIFFFHTLGVMIPDSTEILKGIYWSGNVNAVKALIREGLITKHDIRFFIGYSGWEQGQLREELLRNSWIVGSLPSKLILNTRPTEMWDSFTQFMGKRYQLWNKFPVNPRDN